ncbi:hypothetical protein X975_22613, partial [Stegodyphus mimosarum]
MQPSLSTIQPASMTANDMGAISSTAPTAMPALGAPENHVSAASALTVPPVTAVNNASGAQFQGERTSAVCQAQMQEYLRRRHQMLQQQIMLQSCSCNLQFLVPLILPTFLTRLPVHPWDRTW